MYMQSQKHRIHSEFLQHSHSIQLAVLFSLPHKYIPNQLTSYIHCHHLSSNHHPNHFFFFFSNHFLTRLLQQLPNRQPSRLTFIFSCSKLFDAFYLRKKHNVQILCGSYSVSYDLSLANISIFISTYPPCLPWFLPFIVHSHQNFLDLKSLISDPPCYPELCLFRSSPDELFIIQVSAQTSFLKGIFQPPYLPFLEVTLDLIALVIFFHCTCHLKLSCLLIYLLLYSFIICFSC